ncbi:MAG: peptide chain release factor N(5)-glutamine methyltransferase [Deinococcus sp.]|nr:peptide chain release factor N(5)-glutamine methyltransferase [Deinococcus sp.]
MTEASCTVPAPESFQTVGQALALAGQLLANAGIPSPAAEAALLVSSISGLPHAALALASTTRLTARQRYRLRVLTLARVEERIPLQYLLGSAPFYGLELKVGPGVFIPRPETEGLVELVLARLPQGPVQVADLGTGSGAIALAIKSQRPDVTVHATDLSPQALSFARRNARRLGLEVQFHLGDGYAGLTSLFHAILSNPPYLPQAEIKTLAPELFFEPLPALTPGGDGLDVIRRIISGAPERLVNSGFLALEIHPPLAGAVQQLLLDAGLQGIEILPDLTGRERYAAAVSGCASGAPEAHPLTSAPGPRCKAPLQEGNESVENGAQKRHDHNAGVHGRVVKGVAAVANKQS